MREMSGVQIRKNEIFEAYTGNTVGRRGNVPPQSNSAPLRATIRSAMVLTCQKPIQGNRFGEISEGASGSKSVTCSKRSTGNLGGPSASSRWGRTSQPKEGRHDGRIK
jgi:hypothetical protein